jgi:glycosidase
MAALNKIQADCIELYGEKTGQETFHLLRQMIEAFPLPAHKERGKITQQDALLITYGDQVRQPGEPPLRTLGGFAERYLAGLVSGMHLLPFFPYSSDDGFSVIDYMAVDPNLGSWEDITRLHKRFRLMFDGVINHVSARSSWFKAFLGGDPRYQDYFIVVEDTPDLSQVVRPRALPLLTRVTTSSGPKQVWTTFSTDQIDLNYHTPAVLLEIVRILLFYAGQGAEFLRLDAIAYLWKEIGTSCIHLPQTHRVVQLLRRVLDAAAPQVLLISETNVPHPDNISYFGDGKNEAQLVYNFALPPLVLHALRTGSARALAGWARSLEPPSQDTAFFNFLASHDGIGLNPARGILTEAEIQALVDGALANGGLVSYKQNPDGTQSPYELNINYFDALSSPFRDEPQLKQVARFMVAQAIMLALKGMPGIYFHSLFGSRGWPEGVNQTGRNRTINRQKLQLEELERELGDPGSRPSQVYVRFAQMLKMRGRSRAFHPQAAQAVLDCGEGVFGLRRTSPEGDEAVLCLHNLTDHRQQVSMNASWLAGQEEVWWIDLISAEGIEWKPGSSLQLNPYQVMWLAEAKSWDENPAQWQSGQWVEIIHGPFAGIPGVIERVDRQKRTVRLKVNVYFRETPVDVHFSDIRPMGKKSD